MSPQWRRKHAAANFSIAPKVHQALKELAEHDGLTRSGEFCCVRPGAVSRVSRRCLMLHLEELHPICCDKYLATFYDDSLLEEAAELTVAVDLRGDGDIIGADYLDMHEQADMIAFVRAEVAGREELDAEARRAHEAGL